MKGLKPCPFCGSEAEISINKTTQAQTSVITCSKCSCRKTLIKYPSYEGNIIEDAFEAWNTRKPTDKVIEQLEELEKEHPYRVIGQPNTYSQYNQGWCDCIDRVIGIVKKGGAE